MSLNVKYDIQFSKIKSVNTRDVMLSHEPADMMLDKGGHNVGFHSFVDMDVMIDFFDLFNYKNRF